MRNFHSIIYLNRYGLMVVLPRQLRSRQFLRHSHRFLCESFSSEELIISPSISGVRPAPSTLSTCWPRATR